MAKSLKSSVQGRTIQSVSRALNILETLSTAQGEMPLNDIARLTELNVSTCHHILLTLMHRDYVGQNPKGRAYFLGNKVLELSSNRARQFNLVDLAMPELRQLNHRINENVHLAVVQGNDLLSLARLDSTQVVRINTDSISLANAAHATAIGKSILAWLPDNEIARIIAAKGLNRFTEHTIVDEDELIESLRLVRRYGYAMDKEEFLPGVVCVGNALRDYSGTVLGSISSTMPESRAKDAHLDMVTDAVKECVATLSEKLNRPDGGNVAPQ